MDLKLRDRTALITGASKGIGFAIAATLAEEGCNLILVSRTAADIKAAGQRILQTSPVSVVTHALDIAQSASIAQLAAEHPDIDILVNNAGAIPAGRIDEIDEKRWRDSWDLKVFGYINMTRAFYAAMKKRGGGVIINTASTAGLRPRPGLTWYNASKGAVITMTKSMAVELAPDQIRVNALCPVAGETGMLSEFMGGDTPENRAKFTASIPLGRLSTPEDIANAALYLASDEASLITGVAFEIDGGRCI